MDDKIYMKRLGDQSDFGKEREMIKIVIFIKLFNLPKNTHN